ncbi:MAG: hypothetical protein ACT4NK_07765 [Limnobacter sp.]|uniref:hypothetical protein n=1 Tax=Limnobacter sp. TaxID=2003368 RepID=UPI004037BD30
MNRENFKASEEYWIGNIPVDWQQIFARRVFSQVRLSKQESDEQLTASQKYGVIPQKLFMEKQGHKVALANKGTDGFKHVDKGDFVISLRSFQGGIEICHHSGCVSPAYVILKLNKGERRFFQYLLKCDAFIARFQSLTDGLRDGKMVSYEQFGGIKLPFPDSYEQRQIAAYLNRETAKIDKLIVKQQKLIKLLQEKRLAVISQAVTKGLDPKVKMKESGVEWLGQVPYHWKVAKTKRFLTTLSGFAFPSSGFSGDKSSARLLRGINVGVSQLKWDDVVYWERHPNDGLEEFELRAGDVVLGMDRPFIGKGLRIATVTQDDIPCLLLQRVLKFKFGVELVPDYFKSLMECGFFAAFVGPEMTGVSVPHISPSQVESFPIPVPPINEQIAILDFLAERGQFFHTLITKSKSSIELLLEHRQALITAAVTGKIDVRGLVSDEEVAVLDADPVLETTEEDFESEVAEADYITEEE